MTKSTVKNTLVAGAIALSLIAAPAAQAQAGKAPSRDTGVGLTIAAQGNAALKLIRDELKAAVKSMQPALPAPRPSKLKVAAPAPAPATGGSLAASAACAE